MTRTSTVRWGILGTARIAARVAAAIHAAEGAELVLVGSRDATRAADWAREHSVPRSCGSYQAVLEDPEVDAVYIPLPPSMHHEWTIRAAELGRHVLCEKPLACTPAEAAEMADACREHGRQLMDGVMWLHHPRAADMRRELDSGCLGELRRVTSSFTFNWDPFPDDDLRLHRELGGGSLLDLGWYCVGATLWALGEMPHRVWGTARWRNETDMNFSGQLWFEGARAASFDCGFDTAIRKWLEVAGTAGTLSLGDYTRPQNPARPTYRVSSADGSSRREVSQSPVQEVCMIEAFCRQAQTEDLNEDWPRRAVQTQQVCAALDQSARIGEPVDLQD